MKLFDLYLRAEQQNTEVLTFALGRTGSMSVLDSGTCFIGMDESVQDGGPEEIVHLAHELGHCITGSFYNRYSPHDLRQKHERKADKWAIREVIPEQELREAVDAGFTEPWDLADLFDVTIPFMMKAMCYYKHGHMDTELCFN